MGDAKDGGIPAMADRGGGITYCWEARAYKPISCFYDFAAPKPVRIGRADFSIRDASPLREKARKACGPL